MNEIFEHRVAPGKGAIWLAAFGVVLLVLVIVINQAYHLMPLAWAAAAVTITWMIFPKPVYGIKVDAEYFVVSAWRKPRYIKLDDIAYLRASNISDETNIILVYKSGDEEPIFASDLPDVDTLAVVMAQHGVPVRGVY
ncbi:MAG: hypothetical protein ACJAVT_002390 [Yoonia sp.]|jgi:hypothetical protein